MSAHEPDIRSACFSRLPNNNNPIPQKMNLSLEKSFGLCYNREEGALCDAKDEAPIVLE